MSLWNVVTLGQFVLKLYDQHTLWWTKTTDVAHGTRQKRHDRAGGYGIDFNLSTLAIRSLYVEASVSVDHHWIWSISTGSAWSMRRLHPESTKTHFSLSDPWRRRSQRLCSPFSSTNTRLSRLRTCDRLIIVKETHAMKDNIMCVLINISVKNFTVS